MKETKKSLFSRFRPVVMFCLIVIMIISGINVFMEYRTRERAEEEYRRLAELARQTTEAATTEAVTEAVTEAETEPAYISPINFEKLLEENPDTIGWIRIPDTNIDYPIVQTDNNDTYLHMDFYKKESVNGTIYLDFESQADMKGRNNILYGHHMKNGSMFKDVVKYKDREFFKNHQYFVIYTPERPIWLKAVSCYYAKADAKVRQTGFENQESFDTFVQTMLSPCEYAEIPEESITSLYTLVTCSYEVDDARTMLYAVEVEQEEYEQATQ